MIWATYNSLDLRSSLIEPSTASPAAVDRTWNYSYDPAGNRTQTQEPGGVTQTSTCDELGKMKSETGTGGQWSERLGRRSLVGAQLSTRGGNV